MLQLSEVSLTLTLAVNFMFAFVMCLFALCAGGTFMKRSGSACHMFGADEGNFFLCLGDAFYDSFLFYRGWKLA